MIKLLSSMKFGILLMAVLAITSILSTLVVPLGILPKIVMILLCINILFCTVKRLPIMIKQMSMKNHFSRIEGEELKNKGSNFTVKAPGTYEEDLLDYFKKHKYSYLKENYGNETKIFAQKGRLSLLAPHLLHIGFFIVLIGAIIGNMYGAEVRIGGQIGETIEIPAEMSSDAVVVIDDFKVIYDEKNSISNWETKVTLKKKDGTDTTSGSTKVNYPLKYEGLVFYQTAYDFLHLVKINTDKMGDFDYTLRDSKLDRMVSAILGKNFILRYAENKNQIVMPKEGHSHNHEHEIIDLKEGQKIEFPNGTLEYLGNNAFTVLTVKRDPGTPIVMTGFAVMIFSSLLFWTGRYRAINILINKDLNKVWFKVNARSKILRDELTNDLVREI